MDLFTPGPDCRSVSQSVSVPAEARLIAAIFTNSAHQVLVRACAKGFWPSKSMAIEQKPTPLSLYKSTRLFENVHSTCAVAPFWCNRGRSIRCKLSYLKSGAHG